jgi:hypothetical protein
MNAKKLSLLPLLAILLLSTFACGAGELEVTSTPTPTPALTPGPTLTPTAPVPVAQGDVVINEVQYDPPQNSNDDYQWVELFNRTDYTIELKDWRIRNICCSDRISQLSLPPGGFAVITATEEGFYTNFPDFAGTIVFVEDGLIGGRLGHSDHLTLEDAERRVIDALSWGSDTSKTPHCDRVAEGHSLERVPAGGEFVDNPNPTPGR